jgi:hypothetical protein
MHLDVSPQKQSRMKRKHYVSATLMSVPSIYKYTLYTDIYKRLQQRTLKRLITKVFIGTFTTSRHNIATIDNYIIFDWMIHSRNRYNCIIVIDVILVVLLQFHVVHAIEWKTFDCGGFCFHLSRRFTGLLVLL